MNYSGSTIVTGNGYIWKTGILCYEAASAYEIIITLIYWTLLAPDFDGVQIDWNTFDSIFIHCLPLATLVIANVVLFVRFEYRHAGMVVGFGVLYAILNLVVTMAYGKPIYDILTWTDLFSVAMIGSLVVIVPLMHLGLTWVNNWKLKFLEKPVVQQNQINE